MTFPEDMIVDGHVVKIEEYSIKTENQSADVVKGKCSCGVVAVTGSRERVRTIVHNKHMGRDKNKR